jgi:asparaginyl-tRNA synthetase
LTRSRKWRACQGPTANEKVIEVSEVADPVLWRLSSTRFLDIVSDPLYRTIVDLNDLLTYTSTCFWRDRGIKATHFPITTASVSSPVGLGSDSLPVAVDILGQRTFLADSMQFLLEYACRFNTAGAWYILPSFRGEEPDSTHLNQFFHSEAEVFGDLDTVISVASAYVRALAASVLDELGPRLFEQGRSTDHIEQMAELRTIPRITFDQAAEHLRGDDRAMISYPDWRTLTRHGEQRLMAEVSPVLWVTRFDHLSAPFYQAFADTSRTKAANADLLFGPGEIIGAGQRHETADDIHAALKLHGVPSSPYDWYIRMKERYPMPTAGFGMGVERWLMWILGEQDIRDVQLALRLKGQCSNP